MAHAGNIDNAWCSTGRIAAVREPTLSGRHTARRAKGAAARATHETLKPAVDAGCLLATGTRRRPRVTTPEAIAYAWLPNERQPTLSRLIATLAPCEKVQQLGLPRCLGAADARRSAPARLLPHRLRVAVVANVQQCSAHCVEPSFVQPTTMNVWAAYRGEAELYTRHPTCGYEWNLVQSSAELHRL